MDPFAPHAPSHRDPIAVRGMRWLSMACAAIAVLVGSVTLASWWVGPRGLRTWAGPIEIQPNAALGILVLGLAVLCGRLGGIARRVAPPLAVLASALGLATLLEHLSGVDLHLDRALVEIPDATPGTLAPGRMGPPASLNLALAGAALVLGASPAPRRRAAATVLGLLALPLPLLALVGYAYQVSFLYDLPRATALALPTALGLLVVDVAVLLARPDGLVASLAAQGSGTAVARRMMVYAVALPFALGWIALSVSGAGPRGAFAVSLVVVALTMVLVLLVLRDARVLDRLAAAQERAHAEREASREQLAQALRREQEARVAAEQASKARDEFISTLSHELRTPLNAILGWNRLLREAAGDPERLARGVAVVERNGRALAQVVSDLLDISRLARGVIQLERVEADLGAALRAAAEEVRAAAVTKGVALSVVVEEGVPLVTGDPARLQQIAWNLLANAVKFTPAGGRVVAVLSAEDGQAALTVEDDGAGIPPEFLPHIFERFRQADGSATRRHGGLGLGLALTRELVLLHGGRVDASSAGLGQGATFRVRLPGAPAAVEAQRAQPAGRARPDLGGARILVVDDDADARELLVQLLAGWGASPVAAASAREALARAAAERPDLLISDIAMPGEDGCVLIEELRAVERGLGAPPVPAVALTAFTRPEDRRRVLAAGFDAHVAKPATLEELLEIIGRVPVAEREQA